MKYRVTLSLVLALQGAVWAGNGHHDSTLIIPEPEDVYEALQSGLIDYDDYQHLLEIAESGHLTPQDSIYLLGFPDLLLGISGNPLIDQADSASVKNDEATDDSSSPNRHILLFRQAHKIDPEGEMSRLCRFQSDFGHWNVSGQISKAYSGAMQWTRRQVGYRLSEKRGNKSSVVIGNFNEQFGLGLTYGYHGQLLHKDNDRRADEQFLFPTYGGSNGAALSLARNGGELKAVVDVDRADSVDKNFIGVSLPWLVPFGQLQMSLCYGRLRQRISGEQTEAVFFSAAGKSTTRRHDLHYETALARKSNRSLFAAAMSAKWSLPSISVQMTGWHYDTDYPAWFAGGPSSRRYRTTDLEEFDFSYRDRFSGETGVVLKSAIDLGPTTTFQAATGYSWRDAELNRAEIKLALKQELAQGYRAGLQIYWRAEDIGADGGRQDWFLGEAARSVDNVKARLACGYRFDRENGRNDWLMLTEIRVADRTGVWQALVKTDRLRWSDLKNRYLYFALGHETPIRNDLRSVLRYVYRYSRDGDSYGTLRWEVRWAI